MHYFVNSSSYRPQPQYRSRSGVYGFTMPEILVGIIATLILMAGVYSVMTRSFKTTAEKDSERRLEQKAQILRQALSRELQAVGINPRRSPFELDPLPGPLTATYRDCTNASFPLFDVGATTMKQICFGITDARYYKMEYTTDSNGDGDVDNNEARALVLRMGGVYYDPLPQDDPAPPPLILNDVVDLTQMSPKFVPPVETAPGVPTIPNLASIPELCTLAPGKKFTEVYDLFVRSYDAAGSPSYSLLASNVLCFGVAYFRPYADFEACLNCQNNNPAPPPPELTIAKPQDCSTCAGCSNVPVGAELPVNYFLGQQPILSDAEARKGMVFMKYNSKTEALDTDEAYNTMMVKVALVIEDDKITPGKTNPATDRPYNIKRIAITHYIDPANRPCDAQQGSCLFNNSQCLP